jgi:hypothetical protein
MEDEDMKFGPFVDAKAVAEIDVEMAAYLKAISHADDATFKVMEAHVDELIRARCRAMGIPEYEIAGIERESEAAVDKQIASEAHLMKGGGVS